MVFSSPLNFGSSLHLALLLLLIVAMATQVQGRPSPRRPDAQVLQDLFGLKISSLVLAHPEEAAGAEQEGRGRGLFRDEGGPDRGHQRTGMLTLSDTDSITHPAPLLVLVLFNVCWIMTSCPDGCNEQM
ncbi:hypothetical protein QQF64_020161 [Cirrhinus molitorella]|uniref:Uncharacterized protein n=1 Tax=Cirrhinus molitorella TaxID=172907 RepID=A0ABR3L8A9_9TELE